MEHSLDNREERMAFFVHLQKFLDQASEKKQQMSLILLELHDFKKTTANLGFESAYLIAQGLQIRLIGYLKSTELVVHAGSDYYAVIIPMILNEGHAEIIANRLLRKLHEPIRLDSKVIELRSSCGMAIYPNHANNTEDLLKCAKIALVNSAEQDYNIVVYRPEFATDLKKHWNVQQEIELGIVENQFELYLQPKIDLQTLEIKGAEALIRWNHPEHNVVSPALFIPIAERTGQILDITEWIIKSAIQNVSEMRKMLPDFVLSLNLSAKILSSPDLIPLIEDALDIWNVPAESIILEVTESTIMTDALSSLNQLQLLKDMGLGISIDDFGTGYSSLSYFKDIPATELKIDKSFVDNLLQNESDRHVVVLIIELAKRFKLSVVAEGIEEKAILDELRTMKCDIAQGYYFSRPVCFDDFVLWAKDYNKKLLKDLVSRLNI